MSNQTVEEITKAIEENLTFEIKTKEEMVKEFSEFEQRILDTVELTPDGLPTINEQLKKLETDTLTSLEILKMKTNETKEMRQRIQCLAMDACGFNMLKDPRTLKPRQREQFNKMVLHFFRDFTPDEIIVKFNETACEVLFNSDCDYTKYSIYV